jgi:hypothetical protein
METVWITNSYPAGTVGQTLQLGAVEGMGGGLEVVLHRVAQGIRGAEGEIATGDAVWARVLRGARTATVVTSTIAASANKAILIEIFISFLL